MNASQPHQVSPSGDDGIYGQYEIRKIRISPDNRKRFNEQALQELAESIKAVGVAQPILIRPVAPTMEEPEEYEIVAGERRYRASKLAGKDTIPAVCRNLSNLEAAKLRILENLQREDPHPMEEAEGYQLLMLQHGFSAEQLADEVKKSKAYVYARLKLCALTPEVRESFLNNDIPASTALLIARIPVPALQVQALQEITRTQGWPVAEPMSYRAAASHIQQRYMLDLKAAVFKVDDAKLLKSAGTCSACPKRTGNQPELFQGISADVCTDPDCYGEKKAAHFAAMTVQANKNGIPVHEGSEGEQLISQANGWNRDCALVVAGASLWNFDRNAPHTKNHGRVSDYLPEKAMPSVAAYAKRADGDLVALYKREDVQAALEANGACETAEAHAERMRQAEANATPDPKREAEKRKEAEIEKKVSDIRSFRTTLYSRVRDHMAGHGLSLDSLRAITKHALDGDLRLPAELSHLYSFNVHDSNAVAAHIDQATMPEVQLLLIDAILGHTLDVDSWSVKHGDVDEDGFDTVLNIASYESIDANQVREELFPSPIDVSNLNADGLVDYLKPRLVRINEIKDAVIADRPDLVKAFEQAANSLDYVYAAGGFQLQEAKPENPTPAERRADQPGTATNPQEAAVKVDGATDTAAAAAGEDQSTSADMKPTAAAKKPKKKVVNIKEIA